jgi:hypothetical protein
MRLPPKPSGQNVLQTPAFRLIHHPEPEFGAFDPKTQHVLLAFGVKRQRHVERLVPDNTLGGRPFHPTISYKPGAAQPVGGSWYQPTKQPTAMRPSQRTAP